jgi:putative membrane protein
MGRELLIGSTADAPEVRLWRFNVGNYNLSLALGLIAGFVALHLGHETVGRTLIIYLSFFMIGGGIMRFISDSKLWRLPQTGTTPYRRPRPPAGGLPD